MCVLCGAARYLGLFDTQQRARVERVTPASPEAVALSVVNCDEHDSTLPPLSPST